MKQHLPFQRPLRHAHEDDESSPTLVGGPRPSSVPEDEARTSFHGDYSVRSQPLLRPTLLLLALLFAWWTVQILQAPQVPWLVGVCGGTGLLYLALWAASHHVPLPWMERLVVLVTAIAAAALVTLEVFSTHKGIAPPHAALVLLILVGYTAMGARLLWASILGWGGMAGWAISLLAAGVSPDGLLPVLWLLSAANLVGMMAAMNAEQHARRAYALDRAIRYEQARSKGVEHKLARKNRILREMAIVDGMTGLYNRRRFDEKLRREWSRMRRTQEPLSLIMCDVDHFKLYNDSRGHPMGDRCLRAIAHVVRSHARRASDLAARYGGEEFTVLLPHCSEEDARRLAERICGAVEEMGLWHPHPQVDGPVTLSLGVATLVPRAHLSPKALVERADEALYRAKGAGRNRVAVYDGQAQSVKTGASRDDEHRSDPGHI